VCLQNPSDWCQHATLSVCACCAKIGYQKHFEQCSQRGWRILKQLCHSEQLSITRATHRARSVAGHVEQDVDGSAPIRHGAPHGLRSSDSSRFNGGTDACWDGRFKMDLEYDPSGCMVCLQGKWQLLCPLGPSPVSNRCVAMETGDTYKLTHNMQTVRYILTERDTC
jgi:hypothetical protein